MKKKKKNQQQRPKLKKKKTKNENAPVDRKGAEPESFLAEMASWFSAHQQQIDQLFARDDADGLGSVDLKDFQLGLINLGVPLQHLQLLQLIQLLRNDDDTVAYRDLSRRAQTLRFVRLDVRLIHFHSSANHPGNFQALLPSGCRVLGLMETIRRRLGVPASGLRVFRSGAPGEDAPLPPAGSLEDCGFRGGPEERPPVATVYYDYTPPFTDCPLLNCDHYFRPQQQQGGLTAGH